MDVIIITCCLAGENSLGFLYQKDFYYQNCLILSPPKIFSLVFQDYSESPVNLDFSNMRPGEMEAVFCVTVYDPDADLQLFDKSLFFFLVVLFCFLNQLLLLDFNFPMKQTFSTQLSRKRKRWKKIFI